MSLTHVEDRADALGIVDELRVVEVDPLHDAGWAAFVERASDAVVYHHPAWLSVLQREVERPVHGLVCVDRSGQWLGVLPLVETLGLPLRRGCRTRRRLSSLPRTPFGGPLTIDDRAATALLQVAATQLRPPGVWLEVKLPPGAQIDAPAGMTRVRWLPTYRVDLPPTVGRLPIADGRNRRRVSWACRRARALGLELRLATTQEDVRAWYRLYLESLRAHVTPPRSLRFFEAAWDILGRAGMLRLVLAERLRAGSTEIVAGSVFLHDRSTVYYAFDGRRREEAGLHAGDLIQSETLSWASSEGFRCYDMGEIPDPQSGLEAFKRKFGTVPVPLERLYAPLPTHEDFAGKDAASRGYRLGRAVWRHVPLPATAWAGDRVYRRA